MSHLRQSTPATPNSPRLSWSDERLVKECLKGNEGAWATLIDRYKNLIFSIPIKYGATREDAADVFQTVCLELFSQLQNLRKPGSLRSWLITIAIHQSFHWKRRNRRRSEFEISGVEVEEEGAGETAVAPPEFIEALEREQMVRDAISRLPARCNEMIRLLFFQHPPIPYAELAQSLGLAPGSIGFIRGRCLKRLQKLLEESGF